MLTDFVLNFRTFCRIDILGSVLRNDFTHPIADFGKYQCMEIIRTDRLVQLGDSVALEPKTNIDCCRQADAVPRNRIVGVCRGLQSQIIQKY